MNLYLVQTVNEPMGSLAGWAVDLIESFGGPALVFLCALDSVFPIIPADMVLPLIGFSAAQGAIGIGAATVWATTGSVTGSLGLYAVGALLGGDRAQALLTKIPGLKEQHFDRAEAWFARNSAKAVLFGRMLPLFRTIVPVPAGVGRMPLPKFTLFTTIGSLASNSTLLVAGYLLGEKVPYVFGALVVVAVVFVVCRRVGRRRSEATTVGRDGERGGER